MKPKAKQLSFSKSPISFIKRFMGKHKNLFIGLGFIMPWIVGFVMFTAFPLYSSVQYSISKVEFLLQGINLKSVGFKNFSDVIMTDPTFKLALPQYIFNLATFVPMILVFSILLALMLNQKLKLRKIYRAIFFLPVIIMSGPVVTSLSTMGATTLAGMVDFPVYKFLQMSLPPMVAAPILYIFQNVVLILWFCGVQILLFLSGLQKSDKSIYEAAAVDGASGWQCFWRITLPVMRPFFLLNAIYTIVEVSMNGQNPIITFIQKAMFNPQQGFGFAAATSWIYFAVMLVAVLIAYFAFGFEPKQKVYMSTRFLGKR